MVCWSEDAGGLRFVRVMTSVFVGVETWVVCWSEDMGGLLE